MNIINVSDIVIPAEFKKYSPNKEKIEKVRTYVKEHNELDKPVVLEDKVLVDNYIRYLVAVEMGIKSIPYITTQEYEEKIYKSQSNISYIAGVFRKSEKEYVWKNLKNIPIEVGDKVLVNSKFNKSTKGIITVTKVFTSNDRNLLKHKSVIKNLSATKEE